MISLSFKEKYNGYNGIKGNKFINKIQFKNIY